MFQQVEYVPSSLNGRDSTIAFLAQVIMHHGEIPTSHHTAPDKSQPVHPHDVYVNLDNRTNQEHLSTQLKERIDQAIQAGETVRVAVHNGQRSVGNVKSYDELQDVIDKHFPSGEQCWMVRCENGKYLYEVAFSANGTVTKTLFVEVDFLPPPPPSLPELPSKLSDSLLENMISDQVRNEIRDFVNAYQTHPILAKINQGLLHKLTCSEESMIEYLQMVTEAFFTQNPVTGAQLATYSWIAQCEAHDCVGIYLRVQGQEQAILTVHFCAEKIPVESELRESPTPSEIEVLAETPAEVPQVVEADRISEYDFHTQGLKLSDTLATMYPKEWGTKISEWKLDIYSRKKGHILPSNISLVFKHNETLDSWSVLFEEHEYVSGGDAPLWISLIVRSLNNDPSSLKEVAIPVENVSPIVWKEDPKIFDRLQTGNFVVEFADGTARYLYAKSWKEMIEILKEIGAKFDGEQGKETLVADQTFEVNEQEGSIQVRARTIEGRGRKKKEKVSPVLTLHALSDDEMKDRRKILRAQMTNSDTELNVEGIKTYGKKVILAVFEHERMKQENTPAGLMNAYKKVQAKFSQMSDIEHITLALVEFWDIPEKTFKTDSLNVANILNQLINTVLKEIASTRIAPALDEAVKNEVGGVVQMAELPRRNLLRKAGAAFGLGKSDEERLVGVSSGVNEIIETLGVKDRSTMALLNMWLGYCFDNDKNKLLDEDTSFNLYWQSNEQMLVVQVTGNRLDYLFKKRNAKTTHEKYEAMKTQPYTFRGYRLEAHDKAKRSFIEMYRLMTSGGTEILMILSRRIATLQAKHKEAIALVSGVGGGDAKNEEKVKTKELEVVSDSQSQFGSPIEVEQTVEQIVKEILSELTPQQRNQVILQMAQGEIQTVGELRELADKVKSSY